MRRSPRHYPDPKADQRYKLKATTLDELRRAAREDAEAAVEEARLAASLTWMMNRADFTGGNELSAYSHHQRAALALPRIGDGAWVSPLVSLSVDEQERVKGVAVAVVADWEAAGCPHLKSAIESTHQYVLAAHSRRAGASA